MPGDFNLSKKEPNIKIETGEGILEIVKDNDDNIIFKSDKNRLNLLINYYTEEYDEWRSYHIFRDFFHRVVGRYCLADNDDEYSPKIPEDFIDMENRTITYYSDKKNVGNSLVVTSDDNCMRISLISRGPVRAAKVMISKRDSRYFEYCSEFDKLYNALCAVATEQKEDCSENTKIYTKTK